MIHKIIQEDKEYCCLGFQSFINNKSKKGFSIEKIDESFMLTFRSNNLEDEEQLISILRDKLLGIKIPS